MDQPAAQSAIVSMISSFSSLGRSRKVAIAVVLGRKEMRRCRSGGLAGAMSKVSDQPSNAIVRQICCRCGLYFAFEGVFVLSLIQGCTDLWDRESAFRRHNRRVF